MVVALMWTRLRAADMYHPHQSSDGSAWCGWTMKWTKEQTCMLIELYQSHPVLWDPTDPTYKNKVKTSLFHLCFQHVHDFARNSGRNTVPVLSFMRRAVFRAMF
ncbi:hypothetical protein E2C01_090866 [Portunus trituberculatus]|uniref:MADF domain-containing protein n=1 Tax=Portunus trituberculatus TaxID=210409 RepID=A0A5B7JRC1_PORTR|nr:hypothetical protein [Portunus trituberculatus]